MHRRFTLGACALLWIAAGGCAFDARWPDQPVQESAKAGESTRTYRVDGARTANYEQALRDGEVVRLRFDTDGDGRYDETVDRRADQPDWPHCVLVLDGVPFEVVDELWSEGRFRLFPRPSRVISVFPAMTDLALSRIFQTAPCPGPEALYFDRGQNRLIGGHAAYLEGENAPWLSHVDYHTPQSNGARVYLDPQAMFNEEMTRTLELFVKARSGTVTAYSVGTAGLGTRGGREAIRRYLLTIDKLCERVVYAHRGRVRLSLLADHGHSLTRCRRAKLTPILAAGGYRLTDRIGGRKDVVSPEYGLVTFAALHTDEPAGVADVLVRDAAIDLAAYRAGETVVVRSREGEAEIRRRGERLGYSARRGDPLRLEGIVASLRAQGHVAADGGIDDRALLIATAAHDYPDPLRRLWDCFHGLVRHAPDLAVSFAPAYCRGSWLFDIAIGGAASTHGGLDRESSTTFLLTDIRPVPSVLRAGDVLPALAAARDEAVRNASATAASRLKSEALPPKASD